MSSHNDDNDIVELDDLDLELDDDTGVSDFVFDEFEPTINSDSRPSLADLRPRQSGGSTRVDPDETVDRDPDETSPRQSGAHAPVQGAAVRPSGSHQPVRQSGPQQPIRPSGSHQAVRQSGPQQPIRPSGSHQAVRQSGPQQPIRPSGAHQAVPSAGHASQSGQFQAASQSGQFQAARESGQIPAIGSQEAQRPSGQFGAAKLSSENNFYNMPTGHTGRLPSVSSPAEYKTPKALFLRGLALCLPIALVALGAVAYFTVTRWLSPGEAMLWAGLGVTFPTVFAALIAAWPPEGQKATPKHWIAGLAPGLVFGAAGLIASLAWQQSDIRQQAFEFVPDEPQLLTKIFQEADLELSIASCKRMVKRIELPEWRVAVLRNMTLQPAAAAQCLKTLPEGPERDKVLSTVGARWQKELMAAPEGADNARMCQIAASMSELALDERVINAQLLTCTLSANDEGTQDCCGRVLAQKLSSHDEVIEQLRGSLDYMAGREAAGSLMSMAFHQHNLTKPQNTLARKLKFDSSAGQRATLELACVTLTDQLESSIVPHLAASLNESCPVDHAALSQDAEEWIPVCEQALAALEDDAELEPQRALCDAAEWAFVTVAVEKASRFVAHAIRSNQRSNLGDTIDLGFQVERSEEMSTEEWERKARLQQQLMRDGMSPEKAAARVGMDLSQMARMQPAYQGSPQSTAKGINDIVGKLGSSEAKQVLSQDSMGAMRDAAKEAGLKIESGEGPSDPGKPAQ